RGARADVMRPNCTGALTFVAGAKNCAWLKALKNSARNWRLKRSWKLLFLTAARFQLFVPGPMMILRPAVPNVPARGAANADVSNQRKIVRSPESRLPSANRLARSIVNEPAPEVSEAVMVSGKPDCMLAMALVCQPAARIRAMP